nr:cell division FtsA domain-containing protein [Calidifontibacillus oryziterrae]
MKEQSNGYEVIDFEYKEHDERAMLDGQIHDVLSVSKVITEIKEKLEERHGKLEKVCVAAAGRALKTKRAKVSINISGKPLINKDDIFYLELSAVQQAQLQLASEENSKESFNYYCVGYSVLRYLLDGDSIGSLVAQQGDEATVEIIATFLPKVVVESLIAALNRSNLDMEALTLEPIAAINVLMPPSMRRLNVALVDIGAGTSDIAITDAGTIIAYGMVPIAGDEITEAISDHYLLDFPLAEKAKRDLIENDDIAITDILGFETLVPKSDVVSAIYESLDKLATSISNEILSLNNNKSPKAVMLVGGGSLTPELPHLLAEKLSLPDNRVGIRGIDAIPKLELAEHINKGPELVTPIGIGIASKVSPIHYVSVIVNNRPVRLFDMKQLTVGDSLLAAGIEINKLYGKPGMAAIVTVNNRDITIPGIHGEPPILLKQGQPTSFDDPIEDGDIIMVEKGKDGQAAIVQIKDLIEEAKAIKIWINDHPYNISMKIFRNGKEAAIDDILNDHDKITTFFPKTISDIFESLNMNEFQHSSPFYVFYNNNKIAMSGYGLTYLKNGIQVHSDATVSNEDKITVISGKQPKVKDLLSEKAISLYYQIPVIFNGEQINLQKATLELYRNGEILEEEDTLSVGDHIQSVSKDVEPFIFQDIFRYVDINMPKIQIGNFTILKNGEETTFYDQLAPGDELALVWPEMSEDSATSQNIK